MTEHKQHLVNELGQWPFISIVVLNYNGAQRIQKCFKAVLNMNYPNYEVVFIDNNSNDKSLESARQIAEGSSIPCSFVKMTQNIGYSRGKNAGVSASKGEYVWLFDNDIKPDPDCLRKLVCFMSEHPEVALCGPVLLDYSNPEKVVGGGYIMSRLRQPRPYLNALNKTGAYRYVSYISGAVMFVRRKVWDQLGGFEDSGMFFLDDNDFGPRCWISGWKVALLFNCFVMHFQETQESYKYWRWRFRQFAPGTVRGMIRNYSIRSLTLAMPAFFVYTLLKCFKNAIWRLEPRIFIDCFWAFVKAAQGLSESIRQRGQIQRLRVIPDDPFLNF